MAMVPVSQMGTSYPLYRTRLPSCHTHIFSGTSWTVHTPSSRQATGERDPPAASSACRARLHPRCLRPNRQPQALGLWYVWPRCCKEPRVKHTKWVGDGPCSSAVSHVKSIRHHTYACPGWLWCRLKDWASTGLGPPHQVTVVL